MKKVYLMYPPFIAFGEKFKVLIFSLFALTGLLLMSVSSRAQCPGWGMVGSGGFSAANPQAVSMAFTSTGTPYAYYVENWGAFSGPVPPGGFVKRFNGSSWENVGGMIDPEKSPYGGCIAIGPNDTPYVAYENLVITGDEGSYHAMVKKFNGSDWVVVGDSNFSIGAPYGISLTFDNSGVPYVFYGDNTDPFSSATTLVVKKFNGSTWVNVGTPGYFASGIDPYLSATTIKIAADGNPYIAYSEVAYSEDAHAYVKKFNGTSWVDVGTIGAGLTLNGPNALALNSSGTPYLAAMNLFSKPCVLKFNGATWDTVGTPVQNSYTNWVSFSIDAHDNLHLAYDYTRELSSDYPQISVKANYGDGWVYEGCPRFYAAPYPGWPNAQIVRMAINPVNNVPYIAFADSANGQGLSVMKLDNCVSTITGTKTVCTGSTTTLRDARPSGTWSSSNTSLATVGSSSGVVSGIAPGTVTISYSYGSGCLATAVVTVDPYAGVLSGASSVAADNFITLTGSGYYGGTWSSSNTSIATVNAGGVVTGVAIGMATISYSRTNSCGTNVATKVVTVTAATPPITCPSWATVGAEITGPSSAYPLVMANDVNGVPYVAYKDLSDSGIVVKKYNGSAWVTVGDAGFATTVMDRMSMALSPDGTPYVAFEVGNTYYGPTHIQVMKFNGASWQLVGPDTYVAMLASMPSITVDNAGTPYLVYGNDASGDIVVRKFNGSDWAVVGPAGLSASYGSFPKITTNKDGVPYVLYRDVDGLSVIKYLGGSWSLVGAAEFANGDYLGTDIDIDMTGTPYVAYTDVDNGSKASVQKFNGSSWVQVGTAGFSADGAWLFDIEIDGSGTPYLVYSDLTLGGVAQKYNGSSWEYVGSAFGTTGGISLSVTGSGKPYVFYTPGFGAATVVTLENGADAGTITGTATLCTSGTTTLSNATTGGTWSSSNTSVATVGSSSGIVSGITEGTATITYSVSATCGAATTTKVVTVNGAPSAGTITGTATVCTTATTTLTNATTGGTWSSSNTSIATVGSTSGVVAGVSSGNATITYSVSGCGTATATKIVTVNNTPSAGTITGTLSVCTSSTTTLNNATTGGVWTSGSTSVATVGSASGIVSGVSAGNATITYTVTSGCGTASTTATVTVNASPSSIGSITGTLSFCAGATSTLANSASGGTWVSSNTSVATIGSSNGVASGVAGGNATITYILTNECGSATTTAVVTVNGTPSVSSITGTLSVCTGATTSLNNATSGGVWSSSNTAKGTVSGAGVVSGISAGTTTISYTVSNSCGSNAATTIVTVNPVPNAGSITGSSSVSTGSTITLSNAATGGAWSSSNGNATVNSSGVVTGITVGTATISYTVTNSCGTAVAIKVITINSSLSGITGSMAICVGGTTTLSIAETGGIWSSSNTLFATVGSSSGIVTGITPGTVTISYTLDGGTVTAVVTVNGNPAITSGSLSACPGNTITLSGAPSGGVWSSSTPGVATVSGGVVTGASSGTSTISYTNASGCAASVIVTINSSPASISGSPILCVGSTVTYTNSTGGGTWSGASTSVIDGPGGTGAVTGMSAGTAIITYNTAGGCKAILTITVNGIPANITGTLKACPGTSTTLGSSTSGGTWSSASTGIATVGSSSGIVTGVLAGTVVISYSLGTGCAKTAVVTINANPSASVAGSTTICIGLNTTITNSTPGMVSWTSSNTGVATVLSTGVVNGVAAGTANITYTVGGGCYTTTQITVNAKPTINGATSVCPGSTITLTSPTSGGTWSSSNTSAATIGSSTGALTGISAGGSTVITYSLGASCYQVRSEAVSTSPLAIGGYAIACEGTSTTLTHSNAGTWSSGDASVASVGTPTVGVVTGVNAGTTNITFTLNSTGCTTTKVVTVNTVPPAITGTGLVCVGLQTTLANAQTGGSWSSSNTYYANVGSATGIVTASTSAGTATISYSYGANCRTTTVVTVRAVPAAILGPSSVCIGSTVTFSNSTGNGTWSSSNPTAATVAPGSSSYYGAVTGAGAGVTTLTYTNAPSCTRTQTVAVAACRGVNTTGIENANHNVAVSLFPNPTTGSFTVSAHVNGTLSVYTLEGREVSKHEINKGETQISLPNELSRGIYMCRFNGEDGSAVMVRLVVE